MGLHISVEMRKNMVTWRFEQNRTAREIVALAKCLESTVYEVLQLHREYGQITNPFVRTRGRPHILDNEDIQYISSLLQANLALYLDELQEQLDSAI